MVIPGDDSIPGMNSAMSRNHNGAIQPTMIEQKLVNVLASRCAPPMPSRPYGGYGRGYDQGVLQPRQIMHLYSPAGCSGEPGEIILQRAWRIADGLAGVGGAPYGIMRTGTWSCGSPATVRRPCYGRAIRGHEQVGRDAIPGTCGNLAAAEHNAPASPPASVGRV